jgi:hypothetical protein
VWRADREKNMSKTHKSQVMSLPKREMSKLSDSAHEQIRQKKQSVRQQITLHVLWQREVIFNVLCPILPLN